MCIPNDLFTVITRSILLDCVIDNYLDKLISVDGNRKSVPIRVLLADALIFHRKFRLCGELLLRRIRTVCKITLQTELTVLLNRA